MSTTDSNHRGYSVIPAPEQGLDVLPIWLHLNIEGSSDTDTASCVNYLGVSVTLCAEGHDICEPNQDKSNPDMTSRNKQLFHEDSTMNTDMEWEQSHPLSPVSVTTETNTNSVNTQQGPRRRYSFCSKDSIKRRNSRRRSKLEEISELEQMKRSLLSKSFLNLPQKDYCTRTVSSTKIAVSKHNSSRGRRSQSAKDLLTHSLPDAGPCLVTETQHCDRKRKRASTLPTDSNRQEQHEHSYFDKQFISNGTEPSQSYCKECMERNNRHTTKSSGETLDTCHHSKILQCNSVNNNNSSFHPLDGLFKRRLNENRRKIRKFSLTMFLCGCSRRSFRLKKMQKSRAKSGTM